MQYTILLPILLAIFCLSCGKSNVTTQVNANQFTEITIDNAFGKPLRFVAPSEKLGTIGFERNGDTLWATGKPEVLKEKEAMILRWEIGPDTMICRISEADTDKRILLSVTSENKPSQWFLNVEATDKEFFTGVFERVVDGHQDESWKPGLTTALNLRGERAEVHLTPTNSAYAPFYLSSENYGFYVQGTWPGIIDFGKQTSNVVQIAWEGPTFGFTIYTAPNPAGIVQKHALESGPSIVPPRWAYGQWRWRDEHKNLKTYYDETPVSAPYNSALVEDVLMMQTYGIPFTAIWIDRPWGTGRRGYDDFLWDTKRFPEPEKMIAWLNAKNIELMLWLAPWVIGSIADEAVEKGYSMVSLFWEDSTQVQIDFSNPEAVRWWQEKGPAKLAKMGIKGFKLDRADGEMLCDSLHLIAASGKSYRENYNDYPRQYVKATYDAVKPILGDNFVLFPRAQYDGCSRYGVMWAGDTHGSEWGLRSAIIGMLRCSVMGYPLWGSDTGGYWGEFSRETCMRWLAFSCFSPLMEVGPTLDEGLWNSGDTPNYDPELLATWRMYSIVRENLIDYIQQLANEANQTGMPVGRPLFLHYPEQPEAWSDWQTYLLGPDILVSALWEKGTTRHKLYLPKGETWVDAWDKTKHYEGGQQIEVETPLHKIPIFVRKGATIDLGDLNALYSESLIITQKKPDLRKLEENEVW
jgi:alpha-D-xyloside xylohydrolase